MERIYILKRLVDLVGKPYNKEMIEKCFEASAVSERPAGQWKVKDKAFNLKIFDDGTNKFMIVLDFDDVIACVKYIK